MVDRRYVKSTAAQQSTYRTAYAVNNTSNTIIYLINGYIGRATIVFFCQIITVNIHTCLTQTVQMSIRDL